MGKEKGGGKGPPELDSYPLTSPRYVPLLPTHTLSYVDTPTPQLFVTGPSSFSPPTPLRSFFEHPLYYLPVAQRHVYSFSPP